IPVAKAGSSRPSSWLARSFGGGSKSSERRRIGVGLRASGGSRKRASRRRPERSSPSGGRDRPKVVEERRALVLLADRRRLGSGEFQTRRTLPRLPRERERAGEGLVGVREGKVAELVRLANLEAPLRMKEGWLRSTDDRVHVGDLPLPNRELFRTADDAPSGTETHGPCESSCPAPPSCAASSRSGSTWN